MENLANNPTISAMKGVGPTALGEWFRGITTKNCMEIANIVFNTAATIFFALAAAAGYYVYQHPIQYSEHDECPRLLTWVLVTAIVLTVYLTFNFAAIFIKNQTYLAVNLIVFVVVVHIFMMIFNAFASVWIWAGPGTYYNELGCSQLLVNGIKNYLIVWWLYFGVFLFFSFVVALISGAKPAKLNAEEEAAIKESLMQY